MSRFYGPVNPMGSCRARSVYRDFPGPNFGPVLGPFPNQKIGEVSNFQLKIPNKCMRIPILRLQKRAIKTATWKAILLKGNMFLH